MSARSAANCVFPRFPSTRMPMSPTNTLCCHAVRAWAMDTDQLLSENAEHRTSNASIVQPFNPSKADESAREALRDCVIAVPGKLTSAFLALQLLLGEFDFIIVPFDRIFDAIKTGQADAGLIIHEGQLT